MGKKSSILVMLMVIATMGWFAYNSIPYLLPWDEEPVNPPSWSFVGWYDVNEEVEEAKVDEPVTLRLRIENEGNSPVIGNLWVRIKKDLVWQPDLTVKTDNEGISLLPGEDKLIRTVFTPDEPTGAVVREYFFKLYWNRVELYDPQTPGHRNGLEVGE